MAIIAIYLISVLVMIILAWSYARNSKQGSAGTHIKTQPVVQRFYSSDLMKRAFIIRRNNGRYKVVFQQYSEKIIDVRGEVAGWQSLPDEPIVDSLVRAVEIAEEWVHAED
jgi:hypothetical protein